MEFLYWTVLPVVNGLAYWGGAAVAVGRLLSGHTGRWSRLAVAGYVLMVMTWAWIGSGYLLTAAGVLDGGGLAFMNRPVVWITALPAWYGFFVIDRERDRADAETRRQLDAMSERLTGISADGS